MAGANRANRPERCPQLCGMVLGFIGVVFVSWPGRRDDKYRAGRVRGARVADRAEDLTWAAVVALAQHQQWGAFGCSAQLGLGVAFDDIDGDCNRWFTSPRALCLKSCDLLGEPRVCVLAGIGPRSARRRGAGVPNVNGTKADATHRRFVRRHPQCGSRACGVVNTDDDVTGHTCSVFPPQRIGIGRWTRVMGTFGSAIDNQLNALARSKCGRVEPSQGGSLRGIGRRVSSNSPGLVGGACGSDAPENDRLHGMVRDSVSGEMDVEVDDLHVAFGAGAG